MKLTGFALALAAVLAACPIAARAQDVTVPATSIIAGRQAGMDLMSALAGIMKPVAAAKGDPAAFKDAADAIESFGQAIPGLFPVGTEKGHDTKALPAVWSDRAGFEKTAATLVAAAGTLSAAADKKDAAAFADAFQNVGKTCGGCHRTYRAK